MKRVIKEDIAQTLKVIPKALLQEVLEMMCTLSESDYALVAIKGSRFSEVVANLGGEHIDHAAVIDWACSQLDLNQEQLELLHFDGTSVGIPDRLNSLVGFAIPIKEGEDAQMVVVTFREAREEHKFKQGLLSAIIEHSKRLLKLQNAYHNLKHSRDYYKEIIETAGDVIFEANDQGQFTYVNQRMCEVTGFTNAELLQMNILDVLATEDRDRVMDHLLHHIANQISDTNIEFRIVSGSGSFLWVDQNIRLFFGQDGALQKATGVARDITEDRERRRKLKFTSHAVNSAPVGFAWVREDASFASFNELYCELTGRPAEVLESQRVYDIDPNFDETSWVDHWREVQQVGHKTIETTFTGLDGKSRFVELRLNAIQFEQEALIQTMCLDITERMQLEHKLITEKEQFRKTFEFASNGMALLGLDGRWLRVNERVCDITGYTKEELLHTDFQSITHEDDVVRDLQLAQELMDGKRERYNMEKRYYHKSGKPVWVSLAVSLVRDDTGKPMHFVSQIQDISKSKQLSEMTEDQNKRLLNFAHIVSHNLRSHATNISMLLSLISKEIPEVLENEMFPMISSASDKLRETIDHLNEVVAMNEKTLENLERLDLYEFIENARMNVQAQAMSAGLEMINEVPKGTRVSAIPAYMDSILINFLTNAIKYKDPSRKPVVVFSCERVHDYVALSIKDNGLGIDLERHGDKLFGMYKTFHKAEDSKGIGLFITKNQVETMGGFIEVESEVGKGTTFKVYLNHDE